MRSGVVLSGHRGVEAEYPENTLISFRAAAGAEACAAAVAACIRETAKTLSQQSQQ